MSLMKRETKVPEVWDPFPDAFEWPRWFRGADWWKPFNFLEEAGSELATMKAEEFMEGSDLVVRLEMPGIDPDKDVEIHVADNRLQIRAERRHEEKEEGKDYYRREFRYGKFSRTLPLPAGANADNVKASYKDGILDVRVPVDEVKAKGAKVPVTRA